jgi:hypothetical protein
MTLLLSDLLRRVIDEVAKLMNPHVKLPQLTDNDERRMM